MTTARVTQCQGDKNGKYIESSIEELLFDALQEVTWAIEAYADDWNTDSPTDVTVLLPKLQYAVLSYQRTKGEL